MNINHKLILLTYLLASNQLVALAELRSQELKPFKMQGNSQAKSVHQGRTYHDYKGARVLAPKQKRFPILEQLEYLLYPTQSFVDEKPRLRLERLEVAVFGNKQKGSVPTRLHKLKDEITAWQIANEQSMLMLESGTQSKYKQANAYTNHHQKAETHNRSQRHQTNYASRPMQQTNLAMQQTHYPPAPVTYQKSVRANRFDYDRANYRLMSPLLKDIGRRSIEALF